MLIVTFMAGISISIPKDAAKQRIQHKAVFNYNHTASRIASHKNQISHLKKNCLV